MAQDPAFVPSPVLARAAAWAVEMHAEQVRKATGIPYVSHLFAVAAVAMEYGADEEQTIAALLHDVIEDTPATPDDVRDGFGDRVAGLVVACSDSEGEPKPPWRERKEAYLHHVVEMRADALVVTMADKLHNAMSIRRDLRAQGLAMFARFTNSEPEDQLWYFEALAAAYRKRVVGQDQLVQLVDELDRVVADVRQQVETSVPGYWHSPWPGEDGGPTRQQAPHGTAGLGLQPGESLELTRRDIFMGTMVVLRDPGEVFVLQHTFGSDTTVSWVERVDPESLETLVRSPDLDAGPFWPGGVACHANGSLYVTYGTWCHRLDPDLRVVASRRLPRDRPYNSLVILPDGSLVMKDFVKDGSASSTLSVLDPDALDDRCEPVVMPEGSISRLSAHGDTLYALGERTALRYRWDGQSASLVLDDDWSVPYLTRPDQSYAWDPVIAGDQVWFMDNGDHTYQGTMVGQGVAAGPLHLVRIPVAGGTPQLVEVSGLPHGTQTNLPLYDLDRRIVAAYDSGNGVLAAWRYDGGDELAPLWRKDLNASMHMIRYPDTGELVVNDHDPEAGDSLVVLDIETGDERGRVATGSADQAVVFPAAGFGRDLYYCSFSTLARVSVV